MSHALVLVLALSVNVVIVGLLLFAYHSPRCRGTVPGAQIPVRHPAGKVAGDRDLIDKLNKID